MQHQFSKRYIARINGIEDKENHRRVVGNDVKLYKKIVMNKDIVKLDLTLTKIYFLKDDTQKKHV